MKYDIELEKNQTTLSRNDLMGKVVKCTGYMSSKPIYFNCSDKIVINHDKSLEDFTNLIKDTLWAEFKEHLISMHLVDFVPGKTLAPFKNGQNQAINNRFSELAKLSTSNRKTYFNYLVNIPVTSTKKLIAKELVEFVLSQPHWLQHLSPHVFANIPTHLLPCLLLSCFIPTQESDFPSVLFRNIVALSSIKKLKSDNQNIDELVENTIGLPTEINSESWIRNYYLALFKFGTLHDFWLAPVTREAIRLQSRVIVPCDIVELANQFKEQNKSTPSQITSAWSRIILSTNINSIHDIPIQLASLALVSSKDTNLDPHKLFLISILEKYNKANKIKFPLKYASVSNTHTFFSDWIHTEKTGATHKGEILLNEEWTDFFNLFNNTSKASDNHKKGIATPLIEWAVINRKFTSPWEIKPTDLKSAGLAKPDTFYYFINSKINKKLQKSLTKKVKNKMWTGTAAMYQSVVNDQLLEGKTNTNPFKDLNNVRFSGASSSSKTHRKRICQSGVDVMLDILYCPDEDGNPTYKWVKERSINTTSSGTDHVEIWDEDKGKYITVFCPSRTHALTLLLLLPLRGVQVRWLDSGSLDQSLYCPDTKKMMDNSEKQQYWMNELQYDHYDIAGCDTGVIQFVEDEYIANEKDYNIYINSNKTQLWDPESRDGYYIPWPYLQEEAEPEVTEKSESSEKSKITEKAEVLNRPYEILFNQLKWVNTFCPNQTPISYVHVTEDRGRVTDVADVLTNTPFFTPLFVDITSPISYERNGKTYNAFAPISKGKITSLFKDLCIEADRVCKEQGLPYRFTKADGTPLFDVHCLRVAGISNLISAGVPIHIVSEFVAGHATVVMTLGYFKTLSSEVRQRLIEKWANDPIDSGLDTIFQSLEEGKKVVLHNVAGEKYNIVSENLSTMVSVDGGVCPLGGKGCEGCKKGMRSYETTNSDEMKEVFVTVEGGCSNCIHWLTGDDFIVEQVLECNRMMFKMRLDGKETLELRETLAEIEWDIDEAECIKEKSKLTLRKMNLVDNINSREESMAPYLIGWSNRIKTLDQSTALLAESDDNENKLILFGDLNQHNISTQLEMSSDFDLARAVLEQSTILPRHIAPIPKDASILVREGMDIIMANIGNPGLIARIPDEATATKTASVLANAINDLCSTQDINGVLEGRSSLGISNDDKEALNDLATSIISNSNALPNNKNKHLGTKNDK
jgi:hypothetical protein